jgi:hypothetical protein
MLGAAMALPHHCMADGFAASQQLHCHHLFLLLLFYASDRPGFLLADGSTRDDPS